MRYLVLACITCFLTVSLLIILVKSQVKDYEETYTNMVGKKILFEKDSVTIIDYSMIHETYTLSNSKTISIKLIKK